VKILASEVFHMRPHLPAFVPNQAPIAIPHSTPSLLSHNNPTMDSPLLTLDLLLHVLHRTLFHPFIASLIPLCYRALGAPTTSVPFLVTAAYAAFIALCWLLSAFNQRLAFGPPRSVNWERELVVITGGAAGLGRVLAQTFGMMGANVAVLDINAPSGGKGEEERWEDVKFYECDVSDPEAVERARDKIISDVGDPHKPPVSFQSIPFLIHHISVPPSPHNPHK